MIRRQLGPLDYLLALLDQQLPVDEDERLRIWQSHFATARGGWQVEFCQRLLRVVKGYIRSPVNQAIVRHDEGLWLAHQGRWDEALTRYRSSLNFFERVGDGERTTAAAK